MTSLVAGVAGGVACHAVANLASCSAGHGKTSGYLDKQWKFIQQFIQVSMDKQWKFSMEKLLDFRIWISSIYGPWWPVEFG